MTERTKTVLTNTLKTIVTGMDRNTIDELFKHKQTIRMTGTYLKQSEIRPDSMNRAGLMAHRLAEGKAPTDALKIVWDEYIRKIVQDLRCDKDQAIEAFPPVVILMDRLMSQLKQIK